MHVSAYIMDFDNIKANGQVPEVHQVMIIHQVGWADNSDYPRLGWRSMFMIPVTIVAYVHLNAQDAKALHGLVGLVQDLLGCSDGGEDDLWWC